MKPRAAALAVLCALGLTVLSATTSALSRVPIGQSPASMGQSPAPIAVGGHARYSRAPIDLGSPNLSLTVAVVNAGGGAATFDAAKFVANVTGNGSRTQTELASLAKKFGPDNVSAFMKTFHFVIADALAQAAKNGIALPAAPLPDPADAKAVCAAMYNAGLTPAGRYDVEYMLDALVSHPIHVQVMNDIDANPDLGPTADANYHSVLAQVMLDLKAAYQL